MAKKKTIPALVDAAWLCFSICLSSFYAELVHRHRVSDKRHKSEEKCIVYICH